MNITSKYAWIVKGKFRCLFFVLFEDYVDVQKDFGQELLLLLERFARNLKESGAVVHPFDGDIETTREEVFSKSWTEEQKRKIIQTPGLLMITEDFEVFEPSIHPWLHFSFGERIHQGKVSLADFEDLLREIVKIVSNPKRDIFREIYSALSDIKRPSSADIFEAKPGVFGFSVDIKQITEVVKWLCNKYV